MIIRTFTLATLLLAPLAEAKPRDLQGGDGARRGPPQVAFDACANQAEDSACSFTGRRDETVRGSCVAPRHEQPEQEGSLVCVPEGGPPHLRHQRGSSAGGAQR